MEFRDDKKWFNENDKAVKCVFVFLKIHDRPVL